MHHQAQTLNNCGPASVASVLGYYGYQVGQATLNQEGLQVFTLPPDLAGHIARSRYRVLARAYAFPEDGRSALAVMRYLLANEIPAIVLQRLAPDESIAHYRVIQGYDDAAGEFIADDPLLGPHHRIAYATFLALLEDCHPTPAIIPVYPTSKDDFVQALMASWGADAR
jgi:hypothetical protein